MNFKRTDIKCLKVLSYILFGSAIALSDIMCAVVAYNYCKMTYGIKYEMYSAPAYVAYLLAIPYVIGIAVCLLTAIILQKEIRKRE